MVSNDALIEAILGTQSDAIIVTDRDGVINSWNPVPSGYLAFRRMRLSGDRSILSFPTICVLATGTASTV
jgi:PAS domain-containing protein